MRTAAEAFATAVLERCDALLDARAPGRIALVRHLEMAIRMNDGALGDGREIDAVAKTIADAVEASAGASGTTVDDPSGIDECVMFASEIEWRAAHLDAWSRGVSGSDWTFASLEADGEPMRTLTSGEPSQLIAILSLLSRRAPLAPLLAVLPSDLVSQIAIRLGMPDAFSGIAQRVVEYPRWVTEWIESVAADMPRAMAWVLLAVAASEGPRDIDDAVPALAAFVARQDADWSPRADRDSAVSSIDTQFGGVFYLLPLANELTLGEILWRACLPEGHVIAHAVGALIHESDAEPALRMLHGPGNGDAELTVSEAQQAEASLALCEAFLWALPRRTSGALPEPIVRIDDLSGGRLLIVSARHSPHIFFAAPARTPAELLSAMESFLGLWPRSAPAPRADRALASLDRRARIAPLNKRDPPCELLCVDDGSLFASALVTQIAGTLGHLFSARIDADPLAILREYLEVPAGLVRDRFTLTVQIPMERINVAIRRAGLDADPGWAPWLDRRVMFEFVEEPRPSLDTEEA